jgi:hypothetical protein
MITKERIEEAKEAAQEAKMGRPCPICKLYPYYIDAGTALAQGHVYSRAGLSEIGITGMCEYCFDQMELPEERAERTGGAFDQVAYNLFQGRPPVADTVLQTVANLDSYDIESGRYDTDDVDQAQVITSLVTRDVGRPYDASHHKVVLDIDLPAKLIPSSTEGHFHLYIDKEISWGAYVTLLQALAGAGILEQGYVNASLERGLTAVRLPWVRKPEPKVYELIERTLDVVESPEGAPF